MKIIQLDIDPDSILSGLDAMALVEKPAIEENWFAFKSPEITFESILEEIIKLELDKLGAFKKKQFELDVVGLPNYVNELEIDKEVSYTFATIDEKQIIVGPAMVPGKMILRKNEETGEMYYAYFTKETIKKIAYKAMKDKIIDRVNIEHSFEDFVDDVYLAESWLVDNPENDKSREYGFNPTEGTWMVMYKVDNNNIWDNYIKTGKVKGFSIEGFLNEIIVKH